MCGAFMAGSSLLCAVKELDENNGVRLFRGLEYEPQAGIPKRKHFSPVKQILYQ